MREAYRYKLTMNGIDTFNRHNIGIDSCKRMRNGGILSRIFLKYNDERMYINTTMKIPCSHRCPVNELWQVHNTCSPGWLQVPP